MARHMDTTTACAELRSKLFYEQDEQWYFNTREGCKFGPYTSHEQASIARQWFVYCVTQDEALKPSIEETESLFHEEHIELETIQICA